MRFRHAPDKFHRSLQKGHKYDSAVYLSKGWDSLYPEKQADLWSHSQTPQYLQNPAMHKLPNLHQSYTG